MQPPELRKQISIFVPLSDWRAIRAEAAREKIPMTELCRRWMAPSLARLRHDRAPCPADRNHRAGAASRAAGVGPKDEG